MKRDPLGKFFLLAFIVAVATLAAVTRAPDAWWVERAAKAAVIGPWIERLADLYRQPRAAAEALDLEGGAESIYRIDPRRNESRPTIAVEAEKDPVSTSEAFHELASSVSTNLERSGRPEDGNEVEGGRERWILIPMRQEPLPLLGSEPAPTLPVPSRRPDPDVLASATELLADSKGVQTLGPYTLYTDVEDRGLLIYLSAVTAQLDSVYAARYGVEPLPGAREGVVLFASKASYLRFLGGAPEIPQDSVLGMVRAGVVATYSESRGRSEVAGTLIHELTHVLNKRALGPALPAWLDEGLADDLAQSRIEGLRILPGTLGGTSLRRGARIEYKGAHAAAIELGRAVTGGDLSALRALVALDWPAFQRTDGRSLRYGHSSFFIRSLLDSPDLELATAFRGFLRDVSQGREITGEALLNRLGRTWEALDSQLAAFVRRQAVEADLPI